MKINDKTLKLFSKIVKSFAPPKKLTVTEWADENRKLSSETSAEPGQWRTSRTPYLKEIMDAFSDPLINKVVVMSSSQVGKSELINNTCGYIIDQDPGPMLLIQPTLDLVKEYSQKRIGPMLRDTPTLKVKITKDNALIKDFYGGYLALAGANSAAGLASRPIRVILADEIDRFPASAGQEGDPLKLAEQRTITFWNRKFIFVSTPTIKGASRIEVEYNKGTQEKWCICCPSCGTFDYINLDGMNYDSEKIGDGSYRVDNVRYQCSHCLQKFTEYEWRQMPGAWVAFNPHSTHSRSFHMNAFISPWTTWHGLVAEYLEAKHDPETEKVFYNTKLGQSYEMKGEIEDETYLLERREEYGADLPDGVVVLTMGVDVQGNRLEYEVTGWGNKEESWSITYGSIFGDPSGKVVWQDLADIITKTWTFKDGLKIRIGVTFVDSGGHNTTDVYEFVKRYEAHRVFAIKGMGGPGYSIIHKHTKTKQENANLIILGVDSGKSTIMQRLKIKEPGPGYMHFPLSDRYDQTYFKGLISERQVKKKVGGQWKFIWEKTGLTQRNEPLDVKNYAYAAYKLWNPDIEAFRRRLEKARGTSSTTVQAVTKKKRKRGVASKGL